MRYWIGLGSNVGHRLNQLQLARDRLLAFGQVEKQSPIFCSKPWGGVSQNDFFNAVLVFHSSLRPFRLLRKLKHIELQLGRIKTQRWGPRSIDLDILEWNGEIINTEILTIPHPFLEQRLFVLEPLAVVDRDFRLRSGLRVDQVLSRLQPAESEKNCELVIEKW